MFLFTRMGWLVPALWLSAVCVASQVPAGWFFENIPQLSGVAAIFILAAILSTPLVLIAGYCLAENNTPEITTAVTVRPGIKPAGRLAEARSR